MSQEEWTDSGLTPAEVAESAARVMALLVGLVGPPGREWSPKEREAWLIVTRACPALFAKYEGATYREAAREVRGAFHDALGQPAPAPGGEVGDAALGLRWEAVTRHLFGLLDSDEMPDLPDVEAGWARWVAEKSKAAALSD